MRATTSGLESLPGAEIVLPGLNDLREGRDTIEAASVLLARSRLIAAGLGVPEGPATQDEPSHRLYRLLDDSEIPDPYSRYNAILRRVDSFARALEGAGTR
ncbi:MAG: hypothetical protein M3Q53_03335 [Actinomycetota bacterium]|nr:hypothetical protein [Actinomycetota bacterium]